MRGLSGRLVRGVLAGVAGTAAMTAHQELRQRLSDEQGDGGQGEQSDPWESAPAPARVGKRLIEGLLHRPVPASAIPALNQVMHWGYGTSWGAVYAIAGRPLRRAPKWLRGPVFGLDVWIASYVQLVPAGIYEPPWRYPLRSILDEVAYHVTYGSTVAVGYGALNGS